MLRATGGGILIGALGALVFGFLHRRITDPLLDNALSLIIPFAVVFTAEHLHASGVVAVVVTGLVLGHKLPQLLSAASRLQIGAFWRLVRFLLEGLVFLLVGLQLREVLRDLDEPIGSLTLITFAVLATVFLTRFVWLFPATYLARLVPRVRRRDAPAVTEVPDHHRLGRHAGRGDPGRRAGPAADPGRRRAVPQAVVHLAGLRRDRFHPGRPGRHPAAGRPAG